MHSVRYLTSHLLALPKRTMERSRKINCTLHLMAYLDYIILIAAVTSGLYACWIRTGDMMLIVIGSCGLFLFAFCGMLYYYFGRVDISSSFTHLWCGCLLGLIALIGVERDHESDVAITVTIAMLMTSMVIKIFWSLVQRMCGLVTYSSQLLTHVEMFELVGFAIACILRSKDMYTMWLIVLACTVTLVTLRLKTFLALPCLIVFVSVSAVSLFNTIHIPFNVFALICFAVRLFVDPFFDLYFGSLSCMERWDIIFNAHRCLRKLFILVMVTFEIFFFVLSCESSAYHKEWYFAVPAFIIFGFLWICLHIILVLTCWKFSNKLTECVQVYRAMKGESKKNLGMVMASRGLRYFALISRTLVLTAFATTLLLGGISWRDDNGAFMASWLIVLPIESLLHGVLNELGSTLGGTCTGYAVVGPSAFCRPDGSPVLIPASSMEEVNSRSIGLLNTVQRFFLHHMIDVFSCDFSTSGMALGTLQTKMKNFFARQLPDSPRFDTYLVYYSGHVHPNGDWAMADNDVFKFETLMDLWEESGLKDSKCRLIVVQDTNSTSGWLKQITKNTTHVLAMQTCTMDKKAAAFDPETGGTSVGDFTHDWVDFNCSDQSSISWKDPARKIKAVYTVSRPWCEFQFHKPTEEDIDHHWQQGFPRLTHPLIRVLRIPSSLDLFGICVNCWNCLKRWKIKWLPPNVINTGHGFKLVRS